MEVTVSTLSGLADQAEGFDIASVQIVLVPSTLILTFAVGFISCLLASLYPSYKASRKPLIECLNPIAEKTGF